MTFCQVIMKQKILASVPENPYHLPWWAEKVGLQYVHAQQYILTTS